jgi:hypothetical protein
MTELELLDVWRGGASRPLWDTVLSKATAEDNGEARALAGGQLAGLPEPLAALAANRELVRRLVGARWVVMMLAREGGASWTEVAEALGTTGDEAVAAYTAAIDAQARYVGSPLHDAPRARAVLAGPRTSTGTGAGEQR